MIEKDGIKAVFIDEFESQELWIKNKLAPLVDFLWIVPSTNSLIYKKYLEWSTDFSIINLSKNFRNSREVVKVAKTIAKELNYRYRKGIRMPPGNFPTGCIPVFVECFKDAMNIARKGTNEGIVVILNKIKEDYFNILDQLNENWKRYHSQKNDFKDEENEEEEEEEENPYKFLQDGNVLIIDEDASLGFEWSTVIVFERKTDFSSTYHDCNYILRCTTNLIVVRE